LHFLLGSVNPACNQELGSNRVIPSGDSMILQLTTVHENARSALECGGSTPPWPPTLEVNVRRRRAAALQGAFGTVIFKAAKNLALVLVLAIRPAAERDFSLRSE
jgi:hypothetical protein